MRPDYTKNISTFCVKTLPFQEEFFCFVCMRNTWLKLYAIFLISIRKIPFSVANKRKSMFIALLCKIILRCSGFIDSICQRENDTGRPVISACL